MEAPVSITRRRILGVQNVLTKQYMSRNDVFADLCNYYIFEGVERISPEDLCEADGTEGILLTEAGGKRKALERFRDVLKQSVLKLSGKLGILMIGLENQTKLHYAMPVRSMLYDALTYSGQITELSREHRKQGDSMTSEEFLSGMTAEDRLIPVITVVVNFATEPWTAPCSLYEMLEETSPGVLRCISDYRINLIDPHRMCEEDFQKMRGSMQYVMRFIGASSSRKGMEELLSRYRDVYSHMEREVAALLSECANVKLEIEEKEEVVDMCKAWDDMAKESMERGIEQGMERGIECGIERGIEQGMERGERLGDAKRVLQSVSNLTQKSGYSLDEACDLLGISLSEYENARVVIG